MTSEFRVLDASRPIERARWEELWRESPDREVWAIPAYLELFASEGDRVLAAAMSDSTSRILYPFLLRKIPSSVSADSLTDITTPYGYGGPISWGNKIAPAAAQAFWLAFDEWAAEERVVSEFIRFSNFSNAHTWYPGDVVDRQPNIVVALDLDEDALWRSFESKVRKNVKRARNSGVEVAVDERGDSIGDFLNIYETTMNRRAAADDYYFSSEFYDHVHRHLRGNFAYFHARRNEEVISSELVLVSGENIYSFLGGTREDAFLYRPNDLLKYEIMRWAQARGKARFMLGGGVTAGDGIERYKRAFSPKSAVTFRTGQRVLAQVAYARISENNGSSHSGYFPAYRSS